MNTRIETIKHLLESALSPSQLEIIDDSHKHVGHAGAKSGAGHYTVRIASELFSGKSKITQHRLIYQALDSMMPEQIHALKIEIIK